MGTKNFDNALDLITFSRTSRGTALRRVGYGDELVTNGTFDTDISGWTLGADATASVSSGIVTVTNSSYITQSLYQEFPTEIGAFYEITATALSSNLASSFVIANKGGFTWSASGGTRQDVISGHANTTKTITYAATTNSIRITLLAYNNVGGYAEFDNISVKEVIFDRATDPLVLFNHPAEIPRIEYDAAGAVKGLLIEEARTNLLTYSQDFTDASWLKTNGDAFTYNFATAPDGALTATRFNPIFEPDPGGAAKTFRLYTGVNSTIGDVVSFSVYVKPIVATSNLEGPRDVYLVLYADQSQGASFLNLNTLEVTADADHTALVTDEGSGWYRFSISYTCAASDPVNNHFINFSNRSSSQISFDPYPDGNEDVYFWGAQVEAGSFPTSYIPTSGSTVTRAADIASIPVTDFGYNQKAGTVVVEFDSNGSAGADYPRVFALSNTSGTDLTRFLINPTNTTTVAVIKSGSGVALTGWSGSISENVVETVAVAIKKDSFAASLSGAATQTDTSGDMPAAANHLAIGTQSNFANNYLNGHIKSIQYYPRRLSNAQLQELTT